LKEHINKREAGAGGSAWESNPPKTLVVPPNGFEAKFIARTLLNDFLKSRRQGLSTRTIEFYRGYLTRACSVVGVQINGHAVKQYLDSIHCSDGGRHAYYCCLKTFFNWLFSPRSGYGLNKWGIVDMLQQLRERTSLPCNPHTFRRTFANILAKRGVDSLHIMRLGRWESISMVERYTRSVRFEDSMKFYAAIVT
jgi:hypothetical protein